MAVGKDGVGVVSKMGNDCNLKGTPGMRHTKLKRGQTATCECGAEMDWLQVDDEPKRFTCAECGQAKTQIIINTGKDGGR